MPNKSFASVEKFVEFLQTVSPVPPKGTTFQDRDRMRSVELLAEADTASGEGASTACIKAAILADPTYTEASALWAVQFDIPERIGILRELVRIEKEQLDPVLFKEQAGHFWLIHETRPYMRRRIAFLNGLRSLHETEEATACAIDMLQLCPHDNCGARYTLLGLHLQAGRLSQAQALLNKYPEEVSSCFSWARVLLRFLQDDQAAAAEALAQAIDQNAFVAYGFLHREPEHFLADEVEIYSPGTEDEALLCSSWLGAAWTSHPAARAWLKQNIEPDFEPEEPWLSELAGPWAIHKANPPFSAIRTALAKGKHAVPGLLAVLDHLVGLLRTNPYDVRRDPLRTTFLLLGEIGTPELIPAGHRYFQIIARLQGQRDPIQDFTMNELRHCLTNALAPTASNEPDEALDPRIKRQPMLDLEAWIFDRHLYDHARTAAIDALCNALSLGYVDELIARDIADRWFEEEQDNISGPDSWYAICNLCATHGWTYQRANLQSACQKGLVMEDLEDEETILRRLERGEPYYPPAEIDTLAMLREERQMATAHYPSPSGQGLAPPLPSNGMYVPFVRKVSKTGRNEPCPCGSGKKYKKCCI